MSTLAAKTNYVENKQVEGISDHDVIEHVLSRICWVSKEEFLDHVSTHCVDGRSGCAIVGAPGGDAGEFLLILAAVEKVIGQEIQVGSVAKLFEEYRRHYGHFYMHTDAHMLEHLAEDLLQDEELGALVKDLPKEQIVKELENVIRMPPAKIREKLLQRLISVVKLGCGHLSLMRDHESEYGVRKVLVNATLEAFYRTLWSGEHVEWEVLGGEHAERAVLNIIVDSKDQSVKKFPLVAPYCHGEQVFVNHPQAESLILEKSYDFVERHFGALWPIDREVYFGVVGELTGKHTLATLGYLAKGLPIYEAHVTPDGDCSVHLVGKV